VPFVETSRSIFYLLKLTVEEFNKRYIHNHSHEDPMSINFSFDDYEGPSSLM
jgi:hypothetical protein